MNGKEEYIYAGIPTFMGGNYISNCDISKYDVVFVGVPCDYGASYRLGAKYAPRKLREYSFWDRIDGQILYDLDREIEVHTNNLKIADIGDVDINPTDPAKNQEAIEKSVFEIRQSSFPVICGGDHSITYGSFIGVQKAISMIHPDYEVGIIHFDAHLDVEKGYLNMPEIWHGNVFRKLIENGYLEGKNLYTIGVRGVVDKKWYEFELRNSVNVFSANTVKKIGIQSIINHIVNESAERKIKYYVTLDIDVMDISCVAGTGTPQFNGLQPYEINEALIALKALDICGFDIVELNPKIDNSHSSFIIACELIYHFLAMGFNKVGG